MCNCVLSNGDISNDLDGLLTWFQGHGFLKSNIVKDKVTIAQEETIPNIWNGTMFDDLD